MSQNKLATWTSYDSALAVAATFPLLLSDMEYYANVRLERERMRDCLTGIRIFGREAGCVVWSHPTLPIAVFLTLVELQGFAGMGGVRGASGAGISKFGSRRGAVPLLLSLLTSQLVSCQCNVSDNKFSV